MDHYYYLWERIFLQAPHDLARLSCVCRLFHEIIEGNPMLHLLAKYGMRRVTCLHALKEDVFDCFCFLIDQGLCPSPVFQWLEEVCYICHLDKGICQCACYAKEFRQCLIVAPNQYVTYCLQKCPRVLYYDYDYDCPSFDRMISSVSQRDLVSLKNMHAIYKNNEYLRHLDFGQPGHASIYEHYMSQLKTLLSIPTSPECSHYLRQIIEELHDLG